MGPWRGESRPGGGGATIINPVLARFGLKHQMTMSRRAVGLEVWSPDELEMGESLVGQQRAPQNFLAGGGNPLL